MRFSLKYFYLFTSVLLVEVLIALYMRDSFVRPFAGDVLVVILLYFFVRMLFLCTKTKSIIMVLLFAYMIEFGQYFDLVTILNMQDIHIAKIVIGSTFDVMDLVAYSLGAFLIMISRVFVRRQDPK